jgi:choice-of-anchor B domain-containing protein
MLFAAGLGLMALASQTLAKEIPPNPRTEMLYRSGAFMRQIMEDKEKTFTRQREAGAYQSSQYPPIDKRVNCVNGLATAIPGNPNYTFRCNNIDLFNFKSHADLGSPRGEGSSSWGWTSATGREFVAIGQSDGAAFAEITSEGKLVYLGRLPHNSVESLWREIRVYKDYVIIGSEAQRHGIQIFDLKKLLDIDPAHPVTFDNSKDLTGLFTGLPSGRTHNVVVNEASNYIYSVGAQPRDSKCRSGLIFIDVSDPKNPKSPGCAASEGYVHDAQCRIYKGPQTKYNGRELCYGYNEDALVIYDVTDKANWKVLSRTSYEGASYVHQGWLIDPEWHQFMISDDEFDEKNRAGPAADGRPVTYIWDISNLEAPKQTGYYKSNVTGIDHNQYVHDGFSYQSNYGSGFRILDISSIPQDPTGKGVHEVGFFDIYPEDDNEQGGGIVDFVGSWSSYSYFKSGYIFVNTIERGGFVLKRQ